MCLHSLLGQKGFHPDHIGNSNLEPRYEVCLAVAMLCRQPVVALLSVEAIAEAFHDMLQNLFCSGGALARGKAVKIHS